jgi:hypothetical protein
MASGGHSSSRFAILKMKTEHKFKSFEELKIFFNLQNQIWDLENETQNAQSQDAEEKEQHPKYHRA